MKKKKFNPYYNQAYFVSHDLLDLHLAYTIASILKKNLFKKVVDVGCGTGQLVHYLQREGFTAFGCEPATFAYGIAKKINRPHTVFHTGADTLPFENKSLDMVLAISVVEHLTPKELDLFLKEAKRILKDDGLLFAVTPNYAAIWRTLQGKKWFGYSDPTHIQFFTPASLSKRLCKGGFDSHEFQFETLLDPPYVWEFPGILGKLPKILKQVLTYLLISSPFWRMRNSFWVSARSTPISPRCVACQKQTHALFHAIKDDIKHFFYACQACGLIFINPVPKGSSHQLYKASDFYAHAMKTNPQLRAVSFIRGGKQLIKLYGTWCNWLRMKSILHLINGGKLLDVGCGEGEFLQLFPKKVWQKAGVEINPHLVHVAAKQTQSPIYEGAIEKIKLPSNHFDIVTLWHVFEHLKDPNLQLMKLRQILKPKGLLIIEVPQAQALYLKLFGSFWQSLIPPEHIFLWSEKSLAQLLNKHGYTLVSVSYTGITGFSGASSFANWLRGKSVPTWLAVAIAFAVFPMVLVLNLILVKNRENLQIVAQKR